MPRITVGQDCDTFCLTRSHTFHVDKFVYGNLFLWSSSVLEQVSEPCQIVLSLFFFMVPVEPIPCSFKSTTMSGLV